MQKSNMQQYYIVHSASTHTPTAASQFGCRCGSIRAIGFTQIDNTAHPFPTLHSLRDPGEREEQKMEIISPKTRTRLHLGSNPSFCFVEREEERERPLSLAKTIFAFYRHHVQHFHHFSLCFKQ